MTFRTHQAYDRWARQYDTDPNPHLTLEFEDVLALLAPKPGDCILDAACGTGRYTEAMVRRGAHLVGVDFSEKMLVVARIRLPTIPFIHSDVLQRLPFEDGAFNKVLCAQALKHLPDLLPTFREFSRVLRVGGELIFSVTHPEMVWEGYEMNVQPEFNLSQNSDIFHHRFCDYLTAGEAAGLTLLQIKELPVSDKIKHLLTPASYEVVRGRFQIAVFRFVKY